MRKTGNILLLIIILLYVAACNFKSFIQREKPSSEIQKKSVELIIPTVNGMVFIPGGRFQMGSPYKASERPVHPVQVDNFYLDIHEVTVYEFKRFCKATRRRMPKQPKWSDDEHPIVNITWKDANDFARWSGKRLPTEAEWEYAARSNKPGTDYSTDSKQIYGRSYGNIADESMLRIKLRFPIKERYDDGYIHSAPVGSYPANYFSAYDLEGNVLEWCNDWYDEHYYKKGPTQNPAGPDQGTYRIIRGASWNRSGEYLRATYRSWYPKDCAFDFLGFRCAKDYQSPPGSYTNELILKN